ncbi:MAG: AAA family ATPase [Saprospiraceae bacterium]
MQKFKLKSLNTYTSPEWMAYERKKYRSVFLSKDVDYLYFEVALYNYMFGQENWNAQFQIICYKKQEGLDQLMCDLKFDREIVRDQDVYILREGWGNAIKSRYWKKGDYYWEARINGESIGTKNFYIEELDKNLENIISINDLNLSEGDEAGVYDSDPVYFHTFDSKKTRFIYVVLELQNKVSGNRSWWTELFLYFYSESKELKGVASKVVKVLDTDDKIQITLGWGTKMPGSWYQGIYSVEISMLEKHLATINFDVAEEFIEGEPEVYFPEDIDSDFIENQIEDDNSTLDQLLESLNNLVGLQEIKTQIRNHAKYIQFINLRKEKGFKEENEHFFHMVFEGNPGTGKTTVAEMMGMIYKKMGILSKGHVHSADRVDLVGEYIGQTAPKVKEAIEKAKGGVLFIDEAYSLSRENSDSKDFGREVIEILVKEMSDGDGDLLVIAAGYPKEMEYFINSNPGLKSRFKLFFNFPDYLPNELSDIAIIAAQKNEIELSDEAKNKIDELIIKAYRDRDRSFGNARFVYSLIEKAKINLALRIMEHDDYSILTHEQLSLVELCDVEKIEINRVKVLPKIPIDEKALQDAFDELNQLIGMEKVKQEIMETVGIVRYHLESGKNVLNSFYLHTVFIGNPGTGKTTVARILTKIYKALGILERGHMVETDRHGLVAGYVGQTALKTSEKIDEAMGGVLFIDEAYSLLNGNNMNDFGGEAVETLLKKMEDKRGEFFVFVAGYPENMDKFLNMNPGLKSRFDKILKFDDYSATELLEIANSMFVQHQLKLENQGETILMEYFLNLLKRKEKYFANGRKVRNIVSEIIENQNIRIAKMNQDERKNIDISVVLGADIEKAISEEKTIHEHKSIGFRAGSV